MGQLLKRINVWIKQCIELLMYFLNFIKDNWYEKIFMLKELLNFINDLQSESKNLYAQNFIGKEK